MEDKMAQSRLRWYGHLCRKGEDDVVKKVWGWDSEIKLSRGRPQQTWDGVLKKDIKKRGQWWRSGFRIERSGERRSISLPLLNRAIGDDDDDNDKLYCRLSREEHYCI